MTGIRASQDLRHDLARMAALWGGALVVAILLPRSLAFVGPLLVLFTAPGLHIVGPRAVVSDASGSHRLAFVLLLAFAAWALVTAAWSLDATSALQKSAYLAALIAALWWLKQKLVMADERILAGIATGVIIATTVTAAAIAIDALTNQALSRAIMTYLPFMQPRDPKHLTIVDGFVVSRTEAELNRRTAALSVFVWPAVLGFWALWSLRERLFAGLSAGVLRLLLLTGVVGAGALTLAVLFGEHQSSILAAAVSLAVFLLARLLPRVAVAACAAAWLALILLVVPAVLTAYSNGLQQAPWLFHSAKHRIVIWHETAQHIVRSPWLGIGADSTPELNRSMGAGSPKVELDAGFEKTVGRHAHNAYLQVWLELGLPGALLMLAAGLAVLAAIAQLPSATLPFALAHWSAVVAIMATSYSLWQMWVLGAITGAVGTMLIVLRLAALRDELARPARPATETPTAARP